MDIKLLIIGLAVVVGISLLIAVLLAVADKYLKVEEDKRFEKVRSLLPGVDCGACGFPGCNGFANALLSGDAKKISGCKVAKADKHKEIYDYLKATPDANGKVAEVDI